MAPQKINVKERLSDGEIDLSMSDLQDVPVKDIAIYKKVVSLDLSNNHLKKLPGNFATLTHLTKLDLSKNQLAELPENFGDLVKLKYLDLYHNQLQYLPLSFNKLKSLKWLDLKDNPLVPAVSKVAGPCLDAKQCQASAKDVVNFFTQVQEQIANDIENRQKQKQKQLEINLQKEMENKKVKKKDKIKQKKENGPAKENIQKPSNKKNKKAIAAEKQRQNSSSIFKLLIVLTFVLALLFVMTSVKLKYTSVIEETCVNLYSLVTNSLPPYLQIYFTTVGNYVQYVHDKTGNVTLETVNYVTNTNIYLNACNTIHEHANTIKEQYKKYVS